MKKKIERRERGKDIKIIKEFSPILLAAWQRYTLHVFYILCILRSYLLRAISSRPVACYSTKSIKKGLSTSHHPTT